MLIEQSQFFQNYGLKKHNGGGITFYCDILSDKTELDYKESSAFTSLWIVLEEYSDLIDPINDLLDNTMLYDVPTYKTSIIDTTFEENSSGNKGLALYSRY